MKESGSGYWIMGLINEGAWVWLLKENGSDYWIMSLTNEGESVWLLNNGSD